jgi:hypothetical protein
MGIVARLALISLLCLARPVTAQLITVNFSDYAQGPYFGGTAGAFPGSFFGTLDSGAGFVDFMFVVSAAPADSGSRAVAVGALDQELLLPVSHNFLALFSSDSNTQGSGLTDYLEFWVVPLRPGQSDNSWTVVLYPHASNFFDALQHPLETFSAQGEAFLKFRHSSPDIAGFVLFGSGNFEGIDALAFAPPVAP